MFESRKLKLSIVFSLIFLWSWFSVRWGFHKNPTENSRELQMTKALRFFVYTNCIYNKILMFRGSYILKAIQSIMSFNRWVGIHIMTDRYANPGERRDRYNNRQKDEWIDGRTDGHTQRHFHYKCWQTPWKNPNHNIRSWNEFSSEWKLWQRPTHYSTL